MKRFIFPLLVLSVLAGNAFSQTPEERAKRSDEIVVKAEKINILNEVLPVLLTKSQFNDILTALEKVRANVAKIKRLEYDDLLKLEPDLDAAVKGGEERGEVPGQAFTVRLAKTFNAFNIRRMIAGGENTETMRTVMNKVLNSGQKKAAENAIDPKFFEPGVKPEELTPEKKMDIYIQNVLLNPYAYDVLVQLAKRAS